jgi:uncharacterized protein
VSNSAEPKRPLPRLTPENRWFWTGGARDELLIHRCSSCAEWFHPPAPICPICLSRDVGAQPISKRATLMSHTVNQQSWLPGLQVPYIIAIGSLDAAPHVHLMGELLAESGAQIAAGLPLEVSFAHAGDVWIPQFVGVSR